MDHGINSQSKVIRHIILSDVIVSTEGQCLDVTALTPNSVDEWANLQ